MNIKLIFVVVLASVAQGCFAESSGTTDCDSIGGEWAAGLEVLYSEIKSFLADFSESSSADDSAADDSTALKTAVAEWNVATQLILTKAQLTSESIEEEFTALDLEILTHFWDAYDIAKNQSSNACFNETELQAPFDAAHPLIEKYLAGMLDHIYAGKSLTDAGQEKLEAIEKDATEGIDSYLASLLQAVTIMAKTTSEADAPTSLKSLSASETELTRTMIRLGVDMNNMIELVNQY